MSDDTEVFVPTGKGKSKIYHTDPKCDRIGRDPQPRDRDVLDAWGYRVCRYCADDYAPAAIGGRNSGDKELVNLLRGTEL